MSLIFTVMDLSPQKARQLRYGCKIAEIYTYSKHRINKQSEHGIIKKSTCSQHEVGNKSAHSQYRIDNKPANPTLTRSW